MSILAPILPAVNFELPATLRLSEVAEEYRPTAGPNFLPSVEEEVEAAGLLNGDGPTDAEWDARAEDSMALDVVCSGRPWL